MPLAGQDLAVFGESRYPRGRPARRRVHSPVQLGCHEQTFGAWHTICVFVGRSRFQTTRTEGYMLWTIFVILLVLWLLGMVSSYTLGGFIHVLLIIAIAVVLIQLITGRRAV